MGHTVPQVLVAKQSWLPPNKTLVSQRVRETLVPFGVPWVPTSSFLWLSSSSDVLKGGEHRHCCCMAIKAVKIQQGKGRMEPGAFSLSFSEREKKTA